MSVTEPTRAELEAALYRAIAEYGLPAGQMHYGDKHPVLMLARMLVETPKPGTVEAVRSGCTCPVIDNHHGRGRVGEGERYGWFMSKDCPLHGFERGEG